MKGSLLLYTALLYLWVCTSFSSHPGSQTEEHWFCEDLKYTYQIKMHTRGLPQLPESICTDIENARKQSERAVIRYDEALSIEVFSRDEINQLNTNIKQVVYEF